MWSSGRLVTESLPDAHRADGLHVGLLPLKHHIQVNLQNSSCCWMRFYEQYSIYEICRFCWTCIAMDLWSFTTVLAVKQQNLPRLCSWLPLQFYWCGQYAADIVVIRNELNSRYFSISFVLTVTWLAIQSFRRRRKQRMMLTAMETQLEEAEEPGKELEKSVEANGIKEHSKEGSVSKCHAPAKKNEPEWQVLITSLGKMGLIMAYFYLCDR